MGEVSTAPVQARSFEIREFARLAGLTVRTLQHYDRLGLLKPARSRTGSRVYSEADLQALVQIVALKSVGVPLKRIGSLRAGGPSALLQALGSMRRALERRQPVVQRMIFAVRNVEAALVRGEEADPAVLKPLIEALRHETESPSIRKGGLAWEPLRLQWLALLEDIEAAGDAEPRSEAAQTLAGRWERLMSLSAGCVSLRRPLAAQVEDLAAGSSGSVPGGRPFDRIGPALAQLVAKDRHGRGPGRSVQLSRGVP